MTSQSQPARAMPAAIALCAALLLLPIAQAQAPASSGPGPMQGSQDPSSSMASGMGMKDMKVMDMPAMMKGNHDMMSAVQMTGKPDVDFALMMRVHHQGAIDMAQAQLRDGKAPEMRKLAKDIIAAQKKEIAQLDRFLAKNGQPAAKASQ